MLLVNLLMVLLIIIFILVLVLVVVVPRQGGALDLLLRGAAGCLLGTGAEVLTRGEEEVGELGNLTVENLCRHEGQPREELL